MGPMRGSWATGSFGLPSSDARSLFFGDLFDEGSGFFGVRYWRRVARLERHDSNVHALGSLMAEPWPCGLT
jgi:hypothetical protein